MATTTASKRKKAVAATVAAAALLLAGTFAWTSISQQALNESAGIVNVGGRLHDDFDGTNKDVYVENFTDPLNGGQPIYARVRLDEYMEVGQDAGGVDDGDGIDEVVTILDGTVRTDETTWQTHVPSDSCAVCAAEGSGCVIHDCWEWTMGGDTGGSADGQTTYMPTFNKDKDSLDSDRNGTYQGTDKDDKVYYDDYVTYVTEGGETITLSGNYTQPEGAETANELTEANKAITKVTGTALYDDDTDTFDNDGTRPAIETHTAKKTATADVVLMKDWNGKAGNFWVYDADGWAYWANPIMPGEATGLLLDGIKMKRNPGEKCYYGINVVGQFATVGDWEEYFHDGGLPTEKAQDLLNAASANVPKVTVTNTSGTATVETGKSYTFTATSYLGEAEQTGSTYEWFLYDADLNPVTTSSISGGVLDVKSDELTENFIVAARDTATGAIGMSSVAVKQKIELVVKSAEYGSILWKGLNLQLSATQIQNGVTTNESPDVEWSVSSKNSAISNTGLLTASANEIHGTTMTVTATLKDNPTVSGTFEATYRDGYLYLKNEMPISTTATEKTYIDGGWWYKLATNDGKALIWKTDSVTDTNGAAVYIDGGVGEQWSGSPVQTYLNNEYINSLSELSQYLVETTIYTADEGARTIDETTGEPAYTATTDKVFLLSEADLFDTANGVSTTNEKEYTFKSAFNLTRDMLRMATYTDSVYMNEYALRSVVDNNAGTELQATVFYSGSLTSSGKESDHCLRPAMWVTISDNQ